MVVSRFILKISHTKGLKEEDHITNNHKGK
jgi:hypothetical protein